MKRTFFFMMIISTLLLAGCNKDGDRYYSEEAVALAKVVDGKYEGLWTGKVNVPKETFLVEGSCGDGNGGEVPCKMSYHFSALAEGDISMYLHHQEGTNLFEMNISYDVCRYNAHTIYGGRWADEYEETETFSSHIYLRPTAIDKNGQIHFDNIIELKEEGSCIFGPRQADGNTNICYIETVELKNTKVQYNRSTSTLSGSFEYVLTLNIGEKISGKIKFENLLRD